MLGAVLINCNAGTAGFFESYSDRVRTSTHCSCTRVIRSLLLLFLTLFPLPMRRARALPSAAD